jgi:prepilin-type N-terminal cleavage/methylation domain-containing protein
MRMVQVSRRRGRAAAGGRRRRAAFTLIEILVVISVIALLIGAIAIAGVGIMRRQKVELTKNIMRTTLMAIEQFAEADPLKSIYDAKGKETFGAYPPYQLHGWSGNTNVSRPVADAVEAWNAPSTYTLKGRLLRDFNTTNTDAVNIVDDPNTNDNRALYTYMKVYAAAGLQQIPEKALHGLKAGTNEYVNPTGGSAAAGQTGAVDVLGIHDGWDVPLDYFLYVKLEWVPDPTNPPNGMWRVAERKPALRSRGITVEEYQADILGARAEADKWIFSDPLPLPNAGPKRELNLAAYNAFRLNGQLPNPGGPQTNGWVRAVGAGDLNTSLSSDSPGLFGYVP